MAESTLNDRYNDIAGDVGVYLGWGPGEKNGGLAWDDEQQKRIDRYMKSGLRSFYFPAPIDGVMYEWSFLKPIATLTLVESVDTVALPDDFGGFESVITIQPSGTEIRAPWTIRLTLEAAVRASYAECPTTTGRPLQAALVAEKGVSLSKSSRQHLRFWPLPDTDYEVQFQYYLLPDYYDGSKPYAYGGAAHAETILESCLAQAELKGDDMGDGPHAMKFKERLAASISMDRKNKAAFIGYNGDNSDGMENNWYGRHGWQVAGITYNGSPIA